MSLLSFFSTQKSRTVLCQFVTGTSLLFVCSAGFTATFSYPIGTDSLIDNSMGTPIYVSAKQEDSLIDIAVDKLLGQEEIVMANKNVDRWLPGAGAQVLIPSSYLLPDAPRQGIVINLPEYRLYYYVMGKEGKENKIISYSVGIGRVDWKTPLGLTKIVGKVKNPTWTPPASIKAEHLAKGDPLPDVWPAGPDNPLGLFAFRLGIPGYMLHSTNKPQGVGMQVSHGCMRLYPKDIEQLFPILNVGTSVNIINQPIKVGWSNGRLYLESHPNLEGEELSEIQRIEMATSLIDKAKLLQPNITFNLNDEVLKHGLEENTGIPVVISTNEIQSFTPVIPDISTPTLTPSVPMALPTPSTVLSSPLPPPLLPALPVKKTVPKQTLPTVDKKTTQSVVHHEFKKGTKFESKVPPVVPIISPPKL
jgi:L,D-transpeptidase ErfK/SrfK